MTGNEVDYSQTEQYKQGMTFFNELMVHDDIAFRKGHLQLNGWKIENVRLRGLIRKDQKISAGDIREDFKQKGVDMKIGLDIAWLATKRIVDYIVLITGDTDFVPAMKFARREGVRVILNSLTSHCSTSLKEHADQTIELRPYV
ncbi:NYN domain-containing protein [Candidatus Magnetaquicoccus inordinatus]|uniref:NYN domain-containing protein n=1 Tax=Candidatus Magnetaquicoccus inordinatus TaxID=2496818 RepID=UPI00102B7B44|nr:NYN domain-containing protein [Candidatus Magnetaquicoccus inordinatus]